jgi:hypothetical protein
MSFPVPTQSIKTVFSNLQAVILTVVGEGIGAIELGCEVVGKQNKC